MKTLYKTNHLRIVPETEFEEEVLWNMFGHNEIKGFIKTIDGTEMQYIKLHPENKKETPEYNKTTFIVENDNVL